MTFWNIHLVIEHKRLRKLELNLNPRGVEIECNHIFILLRCKLIDCDIYVII
jgi:hypothetical protein